MATNILPFKRLFYRQNDKIGSRYQQQNIDPEGSGFLKNQNFTHLHFLFEVLVGTIMQNSQIRSCRGWREVVGISLF